MLSSKLKEMLDDQCHKINLKVNKGHQIDITLNKVQEPRNGVIQTHFKYKIAIKEQANAVYNK